LRKHIRPVIDVDPRDAGLCFGSARALAVMQRVIELLRGVITMSINMNNDEIPIETGDDYEVVAGEEEIYLEETEEKLRAILISDDLFSSENDS
jgi:hypothetical protein